jgi:NAD(P)H-quinone oxidoreductase subunit 4
MSMKEMGGIAQAMPTVFALFTMGVMASLALPGMSGFAGELAVFVGVTTSDIYSSTFRTVTVFLAAVGVILTPIYLLSMLRQVFYNSGAVPTCDIAPTCDITDADLQSQGNQEPVCFGTNCTLPIDAPFTDARPREVFIAVCFLVLIIGFGVYPKMAMQMYDVKTVAVNAQVRQSYTQIAEVNPQIYREGFLVSKVAESDVTPVLGMVERYPR